MVLPCKWWPLLTVAPGASDSLSPMPLALDSGSLIDSNNIFTEGFYGQDPQTIENGCWNGAIGQAAEPLEKALGWEPEDLDSGAALLSAAH